MLLPGSLRDSTTLPFSIKSTTYDASGPELPESLAPMLPSLRIELDLLT